MQMDVGNFCRSGVIAIFRSGEIEKVPLDASSELHRGELEMIGLALQISADYTSRRHNLSFFKSLKP